MNIMNPSYSTAYRAKLDKWNATRRDEQTRKETTIIDSLWSPAQIVATAVKQWNRTHCENCSRKKQWSRRKLCQDCHKQAVRATWRRNYHKRAEIKAKQDPQGYSIQSSLIHLLPIIRFYEGYRGPK